MYFHSTISIMHFHYAISIVYFHWSMKFQTLNENFVNEQLFPSHPSGT
jgi:hypothetical protein